MTKLWPPEVWLANWLPDVADLTFGPYRALSIVAKVVHIEFGDPSGSLVITHHDS